ncbi:MAG: ribosome assembly RNA-binding protein YhbY [Oscillospiraceae bacterium]|nr:ribosome assembly RNA-binding protein YhbY [Oscillospiraceae bacterium]
MLTSKQRAQLRSMAMNIDTVLQVGKGGITENVIAQTADALRSRELIKGRVLETSLLTAREACEALCEACRAEGVQVIGNKFVIYKRNDKEPKIELVSERRKKK